MAIVIVRHGETALNRARVVQPKDTPLSETGLSQAALVAKRLAEQGGVVRVVSSDLPRALSTASAVADATGLVLETNPLLRERDFGELCGTPYDELKVELFAQGYTPPGGETWEVFFARAAQAFDHVLQRAEGLEGDLVVVTHGLMCHALVGHHCRLPEGEEMPLYWFNAGVTVVDAKAPHAVSLLNCGEHLGFPKESGISGI